MYFIGIGFFKIPFTGGPVVTRCCVAWQTGADGSDRDTTFSRDGVVFARKGRGIKPQVESTTVTGNTNRQRYISHKIKLLHKYLCFDIKFNFSIIISYKVLKNVCYIILKNPDQQIIFSYVGNKRLDLKYSIIIGHANIYTGGNKPTSRDATADNLATSQTGHITLCSNIIKSINIPMADN